MIAKNAKRLVLAVGLALLVPGMAGAAGFSPINDSFWEALLARAWDGLTSVWASAGTSNPQGNQGTNTGATIDPNGACAGDCGASIDPNG